MTIEGKYSVQIDTPLGMIPGKVELKVEKNSISGSCTTQMGTQSLSGTLVSEQEIRCSTRVNSPLGVMDLQITGKIIGLEISGQAKTSSFGSFPFKGKKE